MIKLAEDSGMAVAVMANAKGFFPEDHPNFIGGLWGGRDQSGVSHRPPQFHVWGFNGQGFRGSGSGVFRVKGLSLVFPVNQLHRAAVLRDPALVYRHLDDPPPTCGCMGSWVKACCPCVPQSHTSLPVTVCAPPPPCTCEPQVYSG